MIRKETDGKHFDPPARANANRFTAPQMVGIVLIMKKAFAIFTTQWKNAMIGVCFGNRGKNGRIVNSP